MTTANETRHPQTVSFVLRCHYNNAARDWSRPSFEDTEFDSFEAMFDHYRKERRRRANADKCGYAEYRMELTDHGREMIALYHADPELNYYYNPEKYRDAMEGNWFQV